MAVLRLVLGDGREESALSYRIEQDLVRLSRPDGSEAELDLAAIDLAATFAANAGRVFAPEPMAPRASGEPVLALVSVVERQHGEYRVVEGLVRNRSQGEIRNPVVRALGEDRDGGFVTAEESLLDLSPLAPGSESSFRVILRGGDRVHRVRLGFRELLGDEIPSLETGS